MLLLGGTRETRDGETMERPAGNGTVSLLTLPQQFRKHKTIRFISPSNSTSETDDLLEPIQLVAGACNQPVLALSSGAA
jgi:hypothetical protein